MPIAYSLYKLLVVFDQLSRGKYWRQGDSAWPQFRTLPICSIRCVAGAMCGFRRSRPPIPINVRPPFGVASLIVEAILLALDKP